MCTQKEQDPNKPTNSFLDEGLEISVIAATLRLSSGAGINMSAFFSGLFFLCLHTLKKTLSSHGYYEHDSEFTQLLHPGQQFHPSSPLQPNMAINKYQLCKDLRSRLN